MTTGSVPQKAPRRLGRTFAFIALGIALFTIAFYFGATKLEENDAFCASCHTEPESTYYKRTQAQAATDLASLHAHLNQTDPSNTPTRCIDCHSGPGFSGRAHALGIGARDTVRWVVGSANQPAITTQPINDANCVKCHIDTPTQSGFDKHFHRYLAEWQQKDANAGTCISCHTSHTTDGSATLGHLQQQRTQAVCEVCHVGMIKRE